MTTGAIAFDHVTIDLGRRRVLSDVSFDLPAGRFVGVLGPNGSGKTTLMRAVLGLVAPQTGRITVSGKPVHPGSLRIGYMPQFRSGLAGARLSVRSFMLAAAAGRRWGWPIARKSETAAVEAALASVGASGFANRRIGDLSGGERQRIFLAQALMGDPDILMLDEPLASLDPGNQRTAVDLVRAVATQRGLTVLLSAHEINPILPAVDSILYLGNGHAVAGPIDAVIRADVLSALYGTPVHVSRLNGRIFVMAEQCELEAHPHAGTGHDHLHRESF